MISRGFVGRRVKFSKKSIIKWTGLEDTKHGFVGRRVKLSKKTNH